jgi:hypothetical protein
VSRGRPVRFPAACGLPPDPVPAVGPVVFTARFGGIEQTFDLSDLPCPRLVRPLAAELASLGGDDGPVRTLSPDFQQMARHLRAFVEFAATQAGDERFGLEDLRPRLLEDFEAGLVGRFGTAGKRVQVFMHTVVRLLRAAAQSRPGVLTAPMQARLGYGASLPHHRGTPLDAYPVGGLEAVQHAALADVRSIRDRIDAGRRLAATGRDPQAGGWPARENVLWHIAAHGPLAPAQFRHAHRIRCGPGGIGGRNAELFITPPDLAPLLAGLVCLTGMEPDCAKTLRAGCLSSPSRGFVTLAYEKKRDWAEYLAARVEDEAKEQKAKG